LSGRHRRPAEWRFAGWSGGLCRLRGRILRPPHRAEIAMIIRQSINFAAHLLAGALMGALVVAAVRNRRRARDDVIAPTYPPTTEAQDPAAAI
jgi:acyl-CoA synthetase (AMP-forming)/AMP-acid ligase II